MFNVGDKVSIILNDENDEPKGFRSDILAIIDRTGNIFTIKEKNESIRKDFPAYRLMGLGYDWYENELRPANLSWREVIENDKI